MKDYYLILGLEPEATQSEVKAAYKKMSLKYHPDKNQSDKYFEERFKDIVEAYEILSNLEKRKAYDYKRMSFYSNFQNKNTKQPNYNGDEKFRNEGKKQKETDDKDEPVKHKDLSKKHTEEIREVERLKNKALNESRQKTVVLWVLLIISVIIIYSIKNNSDRIIEENFKPQLANLELENQNLQETLRGSSSLVDQLKLENNLLIIKNNELTKALNIEKDIVSTLHKEVNDKKLELEESHKKANRKVNTPPIKKSVRRSTKSNYGRLISNKTYITNANSIDLLNPIWDNYDLLGNVKSLQQISIRNKTYSTVSSITVSFEIFNSNGTPINSGEFNLVKGDYLSGDLPALSTKQYYVNSYRAPHKKNNESLVLTIKNFNTK